MFSRVLVANRGEIAVRVIRALHELGVEAVAVYSTADAGALHTRLADQAICIGPPSATESYLNLASVVAAGETTGCDAVHPGYGFLAENPDFVKACEENDLVFVGPDADVMARMGDKVEAKRELADAGLPLVPGTEAVGSRAAGAAAAEIGFPVLLKASAGGGGKGMRRVERAEDLEDAFAGASAESSRRFWRRNALPREVDRAGAACRDPGALRRRRWRPHPWRAGMLHSAQASEAGRGVPVSGTR